MITERQLQILNVIVEDYVELGQPIGSKSIIERHQLPISPATVRNEMKQLEDLNLLEKTIRHQVVFLLNKELSIMLINYLSLNLKVRKA